jgi:hypothetical protein
MMVAARRAAFTAVLSMGCMVVPLESGVREKEQCGDSDVARDARYCK